MKIGIYKPFKKVFFHDDKEDNAAWSYEITHVARIFAERGHEIFILSETDLEDGVIDGIKRGETGSTGDVIDGKNRYDRIILWSGPFSLDPRGDNVISHLRLLTPRLDFMLTDLRLVPSNKELYKLFNNIYTQSTRPLPGIGGTYGGVAEFLPYKHKWPDIEEVMKKKDIKFYFGGTERGRLDDFIEYVWRPDHVITTKSAFFKTENRVTRDQYMDLLNRSMYSVVIADVEYNENYFITPRPYENYMHDIISFTDDKFDRDGHIVPLDSWLRVKNYKEMKEKMDYIELPENAMEREQLLILQRMQIKNEYLSGDYVYALLK